MFFKENPILRYFIIYNYIYYNNSFRLYFFQ
ncbi:hypothetical protein ABHD89_001155 [Salinicoccus halitifaciens]|uniref:Uncharacterized protein n=1 Tax=Salinicoccus halitifaciens TaxID=1073415 RepID=A0ABV2E8K7_9STAP